MYDIEAWKKQKKALHLTFDELSNRTGVAVSTLYAIFGNKTTDPRIETVRAIENALNLNDDFTPEERAAGFTDKRKISITPIEDDMLYVFRQIGERFGEQAQRDYITVGENMLKLGKK